MNRSLRHAVAFGSLALAAGVQAQTPASTGGNVRLYGLVDMSAGRFQAFSTSGTGASLAPRVYRAESGRMSTSYIGFNGIEDLGGGLRARFALEAFQRLDTGESGRFGGDGFFSRNAFVGLSGAFGTTQIGRSSTPLFVSTLSFNAFGDSFGFSPSIRQYFSQPALPGGKQTGAIGDTGWNNSIYYSSNNYSGLSFAAMVNAGEGASNAVGRNVSASVTYFGGPVGVTIVGQQARNTDYTNTLPAGFQRQNTYQVGGSYDFSVVKAYAQYGEIRTLSTSSAVEGKSRIGGLGLSVPVGAGRILGQVGYSKTTGGTGTTGSLRTASVGYDYNLSRSTDVYAVYMNERASYLSATANTVAAGIRLRF